jgi:hypothetical protein
MSSDTRPSTCLLLADDEVAQSPPFRLQQVHGRDCSVKGDDAGSILPHYTTEGWVRQVKSDAPGLGCDVGMPKKIDEHNTGGERPLSGHSRIVWLRHP